LRSLVTGGSGFIGSHLVERLLARGDHVTVIDDLSTGRRSNLPASHERLRFLEADLASALHALGPGERFDQIYHLAAAVGVKLVVENPARCIHTNIELTSRLIEFAMAHGPAGKPAPTLIASSSEVYGKADKTPFSEEDDVVYGPTSRTRWSYGMTKAIDEYLALDAHKRLGLPAVVVRFFNTTGPRQVGSYGMVLPNFVASALRGEDLHVFGDGKQIRCFVDVRDVAEVLPRLLAEPRAHGVVMNLGSDQPLTMEQLADLVIRTLSSRSGKRFIPYDVAYSAGFEDLRRRVPDLTRIRRAVGFSPRYALEQTIRDIAGEMNSRPAAENAETHPARRSAQAAPGHAHAGKGGRVA
jgi:UDP-glucose 4-epimerase